MATNLNEKLLSMQLLPSALYEVGRGWTDKRPTHKTQGQSLFTTRSHGLTHKLAHTHRCSVNCAANTALVGGKPDALTFASAC